MLAIIPEDSGSGKQFWEAINRNLLSNKAWVVDTYKGQDKALGYSTMVPRLLNAIKSGDIHSGDTILFAIDNTGSDAVAHEVLNATIICRENGLRLLATTYYCIEEVFLSFKLLEYWVENIDNKYRACIEYIREHILNKLDYYDKMTKQEVDRLLHIDSIENREQFAYHLLRIATSKSKQFKYTKSKLGECWINSCCDIKAKIPQYSTDTCKLGSRYLTASLKLRQIVDNSVLSSDKVDISKLNEIADKC